MAGFIFFFLFGSEETVEVEKKIRSPTNRFPSSISFSHRPAKKHLLPKIYRDLRERARPSFNNTALFLAYQKSNHRFFRGSSSFSLSFSSVLVPNSSEYRSTSGCIRGPNFSSSYPCDTLSYNFHGIGAM